MRQRLVDENIIERKVIRRAGCGRLCESYDARCAIGETSFRHPFCLGGERDCVDRRAAIRSVKSQSLPACGKLEIGMIRAGGRRTIGVKLNVSLQADTNE